MKFEIIYHHGGFYFDTNIELLQDINHLLSQNKNIILCHEEETIDFKKSISCGFFAALPYSRYLKNLLTNKNLNSIDFNDKHVNKTTGPGFFAKAFQNIKLEDILILPTDKIYPVHWSKKEEDKCIKEKNKLIFPCNKYPNSLAIDHFYFGASWN